MEIEDIKEDELCSSNIVDNKTYKIAVDFVMDKMKNAVKHTLGPYGGYTLIADYGNTYASTLPSKDGMRLVQQFKFTNQIADAVYKLIADTSLRINDRVGDGTTSAIIISEALYASVNDNFIKNEEVNITPTAIRIVLDACKDIIIKAATEKCVYAFDDIPESIQKSVIEKVCTVSANNDPVSGKLVSDLVNKRTSKDVYITAEKSFDDNDEVIKDTGFEIGSGIVNACMATEPDRQTCLFMNPLYLVLDGPLTFNDKPSFDKFLNYAIDKKKPLVVVAGEFDQPMKNYLIQLSTAYPVKDNAGKTTGYRKLPVAALHINPSYAKSRERIEDLCMILGATALPTQDGKMIEVSENLRFFEEVLGSSEKFESMTMRTRIFKGAGKPEAVQDRIKVLKEQLTSFSTTDDNMSFFAAEELRKRIAMLNSDLSIIRVGGRSIKEKEARRLLVEDAIFAAKSTLHHGTTIGANASIPHLIALYKEELSKDIIQRLIDNKNNIIVGNTNDEIKGIVEIALDSISVAFKSGYQNVLENAFGENVDRIKGIFDKMEASPIPSAFNLVTGIYESIDPENDSDFRCLEDNDLLVPGNTDVELLDAACMIVGLLTASNQMLTIFPNEVTMYQQAKPK